MTIRGPVAWNDSNRNSEAARARIEWSALESVEAFQELNGRRGAKGDYSLSALS